GDQVVQPLKLGAAQVQTLLLWGLAAVVGYWLLSQLLGLLLSILGHVMWGLKVAFFLGCFLLIVSTVPNPSVQALLLLCLLTLYALLGRLSGARHSGSQLEAKVRNLEWQVEELRRRQRRVSPRNLSKTSEGWEVAPPSTLRTITAYRFTAPWPSAHARGGLSTLWYSQPLPSVHTHRPHPPCGSSQAPPLCTLSGLTCPVVFLRPLPIVQTDRCYPPPGLAGPNPMH
ncbi:transmembrane protein 109, partial [Chelydra serpentina]